tara:strand:+ start:2685 stop:3167 length:483 start_codon:yes stop_codon:yes gene_type:complete
MNKNNNKILIFILLLLLGSILLAFYIEYILGHKPCRLCIYQRYPYYVSILLILNILVINKYPKKTFLGLSIISFIGASIAFYHFGIEQGFINESLVCETQKLGVNPTKEEILMQLSKNTISCRDITFRVLGFSLASINTVFSLVLSYIFFKLFKNYEINR